MAPPRGRWRNGLLSDSRAGIVSCCLNFNVHLSVELSSVAQSCPTLCDPMDCSTPGLPIHHQLPEFTQTHVHRYSFRSCPSQCCFNANLELLDFWFQHQVVSQAAVSCPELNVGSPDENQESSLPDQQGPEARSKGTLGLSSA